VGDALLHLTSYSCGILKQSSVSSEDDTAPIPQHLYVMVFQYNNFVLENKV